MEASLPLKDMRILFLSPSLAGGGAERVILWLAESCQLAGAIVRLVTVSGAESDDYEIPSSIERIPLCLDSAGRNAPRGILGNIRRLRAVAREYKRFSPDIVVGFQTTANCLCVLSAVYAYPFSREKRPRVLISERKYTPALKVSGFWAACRRFSYPQADKVVSQTRLGAKWIEDRGLAVDVGVIPNAVNHPLPLQQPTVLVENIIDTQRPYILAVGRLVADKDFFTLLEAFAILSKRLPQWQLVIAGSGDASEYKVKAKQLGVGQSVYFPGRIGNLRDWYESADLFALSSISEGFPNVLVEAMASRVAVVATDCPTGPTDIVSHGINGMLVKPGGIREMSQALEKLSVDSDFRRKLADQAVNVRERYSAHKVFHQWQDVLLGLRDV